MNYTTFNLLSLLLIVVAIFMGGTYEPNQPAIIFSLFAFLASRANLFFEVGSGTRVFMLCSLVLAIVSLFFAPVTFGVFLLVMATMMNVGAAIWKLKLE